MLVQSPAMHSETALGQAAAALPLVVVNPRHWSLTSDSYFAANIDKAEKGSFESAKPHTIMKRSPTASRNGTVQSLESQVSGPTNQAGLEQAFSTSIDTNPQENVPVEDTASTVTGASQVEPTVTPASLSSDATTDSQSGKEKFSEEKEGKDGESIGKNTGYENIIQRNYETYPQGWPQLAAFLNSSDNFAIFRHFGTAHCRLLLHLQAELTEIEKQLDDLDKSDSETGPTSKIDLRYRLTRNEWYEGWNPAQKNLLDTFKAKLLEYDDLLLKDSSLRALTPASKTDYFSVFHWVWGKKPLDEGQYDFIFHRGDFVYSARKKQHGAFHGFIDSCLSRWPNFLQRFMQRSERVQGTQDSEVFFFSKARIALAAKLLAVCVAVTILMVPIFLLYLTDLTRKATSIMVLVFVMAFAILISLFTGAKAETVFVGTCTYCAVLVTFLGNVQGRAAIAGHV